MSALFGADPATHTIPAGARAEAEKVFANLTAIIGRRAQRSRLRLSEAREDARFMVEVAANVG